MHQFFFVCAIIIDFLIMFFNVYELDCSQPAWWLVS